MEISIVFDFPSEQNEGISTNGDVFKGLQEFPSF
jgi:hypothetical protein